MRGAPAAKDVLLPGGVDAKLLELAVEAFDLDLELLLRLSRGHCERRFATGLESVSLWFPETCSEIDARFHTFPTHSVPKSSAASQEIPERLRERRVSCGLQREFLTADGLAVAAGGWLGGLFAEFMSHHAERISLSVVRGVNRAIRSHLATLSARLARA